MIFSKYTHKILTISLLSLLLELIIIRLIGSEISIFAYVSNLILVICFFCLGCGYLKQADPVPALRRSFLASCGLFVLIYLPVNIGELEPANVTQYLSRFQDFHIWSTFPAVDKAAAMREVVLGLIIVAGLFFLLYHIFSPLGSILGRLFLQSDRPKLVNYSVNIFGSIAGVVMFNLMSYCYLKPYHWVAVLMVFFVISYLQFREESFKPPEVLTALIFFLALAFVMKISVYDLNSSPAITWSNYHKVMIRQSPYMLGEFGDQARGNFFDILVNNNCIMTIHNLSGEYLSANEKFARALQSKPFHYDYPYTLRPGVHDVLIVGAGAGNDVAAAVRGGAEHVDAVEIEEEFVNLGRIYHPEKPYQSEKVRVVIDDARSYMQKCRKQFDMIVFGLLDSHTLSNANSNVRLDNFVYTRESIAGAASLLKPDGLLFLAFSSDNFIIWRIEKVLLEIFGRDNVIAIDGSKAFRKESYCGVVFIAGRDLRPIKAMLESTQNPALLYLKAHFLPNLTPEELTRIEYITDNWPYFHLERRSIPRVYLLMYLFIIALGFLFLAKDIRGLKPRALIFFFFGLSFMLLETHIITKSALLFGSTWLTFSYVIIGILCFILIANYVILSGRRPAEVPLYALLAGSLLVNFLIPAGSYLSLPFVIRTIIFLVMSIFPLMCAAILFAIYFDGASHPDKALGANILGSLFGGMLESLSLVWGLKIIMLLCMAFYLMAFLMARLTAGGEEAS